MNSTKTNKGFTIIEVVLVLAIAGLIFLMIFLALPALQRSQRDTARKNDLARFASSLTTFKSNSNGKTPWAATDANGVVTTFANVTGGYGGFLTNYLKTGGATFQDPSTNADYALDTSNNADVTAAAQLKIFKTAGTDCTAATPSNAATATQFVAVMYQENGGKTCQNL
jgi:prepilin-type N-terminal cleavage/methylation domain-containing protein